MNELFALVNGINICYEIHGEGFPIILVHGFAKKEFWICQINELSKKYKVIIFDNRGVGKSEKPNEPYTMEILVNDLKGLMEYLKINKAHLIGHSEGGMIIQNFVIKYPDLAEKIILMSTNMGFPDNSAVELFKNNQIAIYESRLKDPTKAFYDKMKMRFSRKFLKEMEQNPDKKFHSIFSVRDLMNNDNIDPWTPQDISNHAYALNTHNTTNLLNKIKHKTLILTGDKDRLTPKIASEQIQEKISGSKLIVIEGGHYFPLEKAPDVNKYILEFLSEQ